VPAPSSGDDVSALRTLAAALRTVQLPAWLREALDPEAVAAELHDRIGEVVPGAVGLSRVRLRDARARRSWALRFDADVVTEEGTRTVALVAELPLPGSAPATPDQALLLPGLGLRIAAVAGDPGLPALETLAAPVTARPVLESAMRDAGRPGLRLRAVRPRVVRHKPGHRATLVFELRYAEGADVDWPRRVVAKTYRDDDGASTNGWMTALWESGLGRAGVPRLAEPMGYLVDEHTLLQGAIAGDRTLADLLTAESPSPERLEEALLGAADGLVALHGCGVTTGPPRTAAAELTSARRLLDRVGRSLPPRNRAEAEALLAALSDLMGDSASEPVPVHGAFRPAQVLLGGPQPGFLDFDGFGQGEPAVDVGRFLARVAELTAASDTSAERDGRELAGLFVDRYRSGAPLSRRRTTRWVVLDLVVGAVRHWYRARPNRAALLLGLLDDALDDVR
jgi:hypothetical protein